MSQQSESRIAAVYADGGVILKNPSEIGGTWAYCFVDDQGHRIREHSGLVLPRDVYPLPAVTNNVTELYALVRAILNTPVDFDGTFYSDSQVTLIRVFENGRLNNVPDFLAEATGRARARLRHFEGFRYCLLDGHPTVEQLRCGFGKRGNRCSEHNVRCDALCQQQAQRYLRETRLKQETAT